LTRHESNLGGLAPAVTCFGPPTKHVDDVERWNVTQQWNTVSWLLVGQTGRWISCMA